VIYLTFLNRNHDFLQVQPGGKPMATAQRVRESAGLQNALVKETAYGTPPRRTRQQLRTRIGKGGSGPAAL
jgi:hypothetical protein